VHRAARAKSRLPRRICLASVGRFVALRFSLKQASRETDIKVLHLKFLRAPCVSCACVRARARARARARVCVCVCVCVNIYIGNHAIEMGYISSLVSDMKKQIKG